MVIRYRRCHATLIGSSRRAWGDGWFDRLVRVRFVDKARILEMLAKHHALLTERLNVDTKVVVYSWTMPEWPPLASTINF